MRFCFAIRELGLVVAFVAATTSLAGNAYSEEPFDVENAIGYASNAVGMQVGPHAFVDHNNQPVSMRDFFGKPVVVSLVYTSCPDFCPMVTDTLFDAVESAESVLGTDAFHVVTVGFDVRVDTPKRMNAFASSMGISKPYWSFVSGEEGSIAAVAEDTGFAYQRTPWGFDHMALVTLLDSEGRVAKQIYGADFTAPALVEPLKDLTLRGNVSWTSAEGLLNRVKLFCTVYDPSRGRYMLDYSIVVSLVIGFLCLSGLAVFIAREWQRTTLMRR